MTPIFDRLALQFQLLVMEPLEPDTLRFLFPNYEQRNLFDMDGRISWRKYASKKRMLVRRTTDVRRALPAPGGSC